MVELFISPETLNIPQMSFLTAVYGVILYQSSQLIAGGSELLLLFPAVAGIVGSVVLPILGAVPDGVMVLFSGLGPDAQSQVSVGVGALAGSTVMLLTFPWFIAIFFGRVPVDEKGTMYGQKSCSVEKPSFFSGGVTFHKSLQKTAWIMLGTTLLFLVIQVPASVEEVKTSDTSSQATVEKWWALGGLALSILAFCGYLLICFQDANEDKALAKVIEGIKERRISIGTALKFAKDTGPSGSKTEPLCKVGQARLQKIVRPFFAIFDTDGNHTLDISEFKNLLLALGERPDPKASDTLKRKDKDKDGRLNFEEVVEFLAEYLKKEKMEELKDVRSFEVEETEAEEMPEDLANLTPEQQMQRVLFRSFWMMGLGTIFVLIFSDPMVDMLSEWGRRLHISPFYISFILAPFASNASELLSAYTYAVKKSQKSITTALSTLIGAACMNNTFCLAIFLALVYFKDLAWKFTAETVAIMLIQWAIGFLTVARQTQTMLVAFLILMCYPGCLFIVWFLENVVGLD